jgi:hypothetical protein
MPQHKYTQVYVMSEVNVSSTRHYSFRVTIKEATRLHRVYYDGSKEFWTERAFPRFPQYVVRECQRQVMSRLLSDETRYFEYDRDRNKRYENLRYHDPEHVREWGKRMAERLAKSRGFKCRRCDAASLAGPCLVCDGCHSCCICEVQS